MSDPFWDEVDRQLPRHRRGAEGWAHRRKSILAAVKGEKAPRPRLAAGLAAGVVMAALTFAVLRKPAAPPPAPAPSEDVEMMEAAPMLDYLDELIDAVELDKA